MGVLEAKTKNKSRNRNLQKIILQGVAAAGILGTALVAPNVLGAMAKLGIIKTRRHREIINRARDRLLENGLLRRNTKGYLEITEKGGVKLRQLELTDFRLRKPRRWDRKWRILIFDIKEKRRSTREKLRRTLQMIGFVQLQKSVWVYPYDCEDLIALLKADFHIGKDILYIIADEVENSGKLARYFNLAEQRYL